MLNKDFAAQNDIIEIEEGYWKKTVGELTVLIEDKGNSLELTVPCASPNVDHQFQIETYIRERTKNILELSFLFDLKYIRILITPKNEKEACIALSKAFEILSDAKNTFDLLPVCMCCERTAEVETIIINDRPVTRCPLCRSQAELSYKQIKVREKYRSISEEERKNHSFIKGPVTEITMIGVRSGLYGTILGGIFMFLSIFLPMFHYMPCFPGAVAGFYAGYHAGKLDNMYSPAKLTLVTLSSLISLFTLSILNVFLLSAGFKLIGLPIGNSSVYFNMDVICTNIILGLGGYFLGELVGNHMGYNTI